LASESPGISTAEAGILLGGGRRARGRAFEPGVPFVTAAGLMGLNAEPGTALPKELDPPPLLTAVENWLTLPEKGKINADPRKITECSGSKILSHGS